MEPLTERWVTWREAWQRALYGPEGFYRSAVPGDHFRTSVHASPLFARAVLQFVRRQHFTGVTDYGAGTGELLRHLAAMAPDLSLTAVEIRPRPADLPTAIDWVPSPPEQIEGLLFANELLDNVPCDVVERDEAGAVRLVEVEPLTGRERRGDLADSEAVAWLDRWWPLEQAGDRAEVGLTRDRFWHEACARITSGASIAIDYGHLRDYRPVLSTIRSYRAGRETPVALDGAHDVTAHVSIDSVADTTGATLARQRNMLRELGLATTRPDLSLAGSDPAGYVHALSASSEAGELTASPGLGDLHWVIAMHSVDEPADSGRGHVGR